MTKTPLVIAAASGLALIVGAGTSLAQTSATEGGHQQLKHAQGPDTGKAKSSPKMTQVPGSSTTGNASGPDGGNGSAPGATTGKATGTGSAGNHTQ